MATSKRPVAKAAVKKKAAPAKKTGKPAPKQPGPKPRADAVAMSGIYKAVMVSDTDPD